MPARRKNVQVLVRVWCVDAYGGESKEGVAKGVGIAMCDDYGVVGLRKSAGEREGERRKGERVREREREEDQTEREERDRNEEKKSKVRERENEHTIGRRRRVCSAKWRPQTLSLLTTDT